MIEENNTNSPKNEKQGWYVGPKNQPENEAPVFRFLPLLTSALRDAGTLFARAACGCCSLHIGKGVGGGIAPAYCTL